MKQAIYIRAIVAAHCEAASIFDLACFENNRTTAMRLRHKGQRKCRQASKFTSKAIALADEQADLITLQAEELERIAQTLTALEVSDGR